MSARREMDGRFFLANRHPLRSLQQFPDLHRPAAQFVQRPGEILLGHLRSRLRWRPLASCPTVPLEEFSEPFGAWRPAVCGGQSAHGFVLAEAEGVDEVEYRPVVVGQAARDAGIGDVVVGQIVQGDTEVRGQAERLVEVRISLPVEPAITGGSGHAGVASDVADPLYTLGLSRFMELVSEIHSPSIGTNSFSCRGHRTAFGENPKLGLQVLELDVLSTRKTAIPRSRGDQ